MGEQNNCRVIAIANQKGGVGKTTTTSNLGIGLARQGKRVLLIDADAQGSLTASLGYREPDKLDITLANVMGNIINEEEMDAAYGILRHEEGVDLMPGNIELSGVEVSLVNVMSRETVLRSYIEEQRSRYDYILIDCPPSLGIMSINAITAAKDGILIPTNLDLMSTRGVENLIEKIAEVQELLLFKFNRIHMGVIGVVLNLYSERRSIDKSIENNLEKFYPIVTFKYQIPESVKAKQAVYAGVLYSHVYKKAADAYINLAKAVDERLIEMNKKGQQILRLEANNARKVGENA